MEYDAWSDLRKVFDAAAEKTGSAIAYSRLRLERAKCLNRLNGLYEELGRASYLPWFAAGSRIRRLWWSKLPGSAGNWKSFVPDWERAAP